MNSVIVHYHLNRGGVAQVVRNHLRALNALPPPLVPERVMLVHAGRREGWPSNLAERLGNIRLTEVVIPELEYDEGAPNNAQPIILADRLQKMLDGLDCTAERTLLHVHNHALGKNVSLPGAVRELADRGFSLLLQIHDFAEDFRPANYCRLRNAIAPDEPARLPDLLYPQAAHIHYAVLNRRDWLVLHDAGVDVQRLHLLPNPVPPPEQLSDRSTARRLIGERFGIGANDRYVLYPVRGIRRKNLGEALLWSAAARAKTAFGFTLPPLNAIEQPTYARWRSLASELQLPCFFEVGSESALSLADNLAACDRVLTTSLAEGFGLVFLEACLWHRPLIGRDLPEITRDFVQEGVTFAGLQPRVDVPVEWIGRHGLRAILAHSYNSTLESYGRAPLSRLALDDGLDGKLRDGCVDFGDLNAEWQERVIRRVCGAADDMEALVKINPFLRDAIASGDAEYSTEADKNAAVAMARYSLDAAGRRLSDIYQNVIASCRGPLCGLSAGDRILDAFLSLPRFRPVRL